MNRLSEFTYRESLNPEKHPTRKIAANVSKSLKMPEIGQVTIKLISVCYLHAGGGEQC